MKKTTPVLEAYRAHLRARGKAIAAEVLTATGLEGQSVHGALQKGLALAMGQSGPVEAWNGGNLWLGGEECHEAACAAGWLLMRLRDELALPLSSLSSLSAEGLAAEVLPADPQS